MAAARGGVPPAETGVTVQIVSGDPLMDRATSIYRQMLAAAGVEGAEAASPPQERPAGLPLGAALLPGAKFYQVFQ